MSSIHVTEAKFLYSVLANNDVECFSSVDEKAFATPVGGSIYKFCAQWNAQHSKLPSLERIKAKFDIELPPTKEKPNECLTDLKNNAMYVSAQTLMRTMVDIVAKCKQDGKTDEETGQAMQLAIEKSQSQLAQAFTTNREVLVGDERFTTRYLGIMNERRNRGGLFQIQYPWPTVNECTLGIDNGQLIAIVGRPGDGKTTLLTYLLCHIYPVVHGKVMVISNEINAISITDRILATTLKVAYNDVRSGAIDDTEIESALLNYNENPIVVLDSEGMGAGSIDSIVAKVRQEHVKMLFIDGAYLMKATGKDMYASAAQISQQLKSLAMSCGIPVVITWQLNRQAGDGGGNANTATIAFSDRLSTDSDVIIAINGTKDMIENKQRILKSVKVRDGSLFEITINCDYDTMDFSQVVVDDGPTIVGDGFLGVNLPPTEDLI